MPARYIAWAGIALAVSAMAQSAVSLQNEYQVRSYRLASERGEMALARGDSAAVALTVTPPTSAAPRVHLYHAVVLARAAGVEPDPSRRRLLLSQATSSIRYAERERPDWGRAALVEAYIGRQRHAGVLDAQALDALSRSFRFTPYLADAGPWRVGAGFASWSRLDEQTRERVLNEAVWLGRDSATLRPLLFAAARSSPAYEAFNIRWLENRRGDADVAVATDRAAP
jgi:hypothetical protein